MCGCFRPCDLSACDVGELRGGASETLEKRIRTMRYGGQPTFPSYHRSDEWVRQNCATNGWPCPKSGGFGAKLGPNFRRNRPTSVQPWPSLAGVRSRAGLGPSSAHFRHNSGLISRQDLDPSFAKFGPDVAQVGRSFPMLFEREPNIGRKGRHHAQHACPPDRPTARPADQPSARPPAPPDRPTARLTDRPDPMLQILAGPPSPTPSNDDLERTKDGHAHVENAAGARTT